MAAPLRARIGAELAAARSARRAGNEGRARVCARRAAGLAARAYLARRSPGASQATAYDALRALAALPGLDADLAAAAGRLIQRVDEDFSLPPQIDLIAEAAVLIEGLERTP